MEFYFYCKLYTTEYLNICRYSIFRNCCILNDTAIKCMYLEKYEKFKLYNDAY